jgi:hypothetical protein
MMVNVKSVFLTCKYAIPQMKKQGGGAIVNIASIGGIRFTLPNCAYAASKAAVIALTRDVALEHAKAGIRCNVILPGLMKTPQAEFYNKDAWAGGDIEEMWRRRNAMSPTGRQGEGWDTAYAALYLVSDEAKYVNGTTLRGDGGLSGTIKGWEQQGVRPSSCRVLCPGIDIGYNMKRAPDSASIEFMGDLSKGDEIRGNEQRENDRSLPDHGPHPAF